MRACMIDPSNLERVSLYRVLVWREPGEEHYACSALPAGVVTGQPDAVAAACAQLGVYIPTNLSGPSVLFGSEVPSRHRAGAERAVREAWQKG